MIKKIILLAFVALQTYSMAPAKEKNITLHIIQTTDVHGSFFPYDFINRKPKAGSLARVSSYVNKLRREYGHRVILLDNGDILQGQPTCYFSNYIDTLSTNIASDFMNAMQYDAAVIGNHDVETGHKVYDKWISEVHCPMLGANIIATQTGRPYVKPYIILNRGGVKVAILGLLTPAIPNWLSEDLWTGLRFEDMVASARYWVGRIQQDEHPDVLVGLFHSGSEGGITTTEYQENASLKVAREVPGFDLVLFGHDHTVYQGTVNCTDGSRVLCLNPANNAINVAEATLTLSKKKGKWKLTSIEGNIKNITDEPVDEELMGLLEPNRNKIEQFVSRKIGYFDRTISSRDCFFGSSAFTDFILNLQLKLTGADISINAPLLFDAEIKEGPIYVSDMFNLYKFENQLYVMKLTGKEIRKHLEMSYDLWVNTMKSSDDHLLLLNESTRNDQQRLGFKNFSFNFDSAAGIDYVVDVTKPDGEKVKILRMSNGAPFDENRWYKVAVNSYRGNGGGELLTRGAGIPQDSLKARILWRSEKDQRYYLMQEIEKTGTMRPRANNNWKFIPEEWTIPAAERDYKILYNK